MSLLDGENTRAGLSLDEAGSNLSLFDAKGRQRIVLFSDDNETGLDLRDANEIVRGSIGYDEETSRVVLYDEKRTAFAGMKVTRSAPELTLKDKEGKELFRQPQPSP